MGTPESYLLIAGLFKFMNDGSDESVNFIKEVAKNHNCPIVRHEAIFSLGETVAKDSVEFLKKIVKEDENYVVKHEALIAIGTLGGEGDIPFLEEYTKCEIPEVRNSALVGIQRINDETDYEIEVEKNKEKFIVNLRDFAPEKQNRRIQTLFQLMLMATKGDKTAVDSIFYSLVNDPSTVVRHEAGFVLGEVGTPYAVEKMIEALKTETSPIVIHETLFALGTSGKMDALKTIESYIENEDYIISESAKIAKDRLLKLKNPYSGARHFLK